MEELKKCWAFKGCGREAGGRNADRQGLCDAARFNSTACWITAGPDSRDSLGRCTEVLRGKACSDCDYYAYFMRETLGKLRAVAEEEEEGGPRDWVSLTR